MIGEETKNAEKQRLYVAHSKYLKYVNLPFALDTEKMFSINE